MDIIKNTEDFIKKAKETHGTKFDYTKTNYINAETKVCITLPCYGDFWQIPYLHLISKTGCCDHFRRQMNFIERAKNKYNNKFDYSKVVYVDNKTKVCIVCPEHGEFWQSPVQHLATVYGCPQCGQDMALKLAFKYTPETFIEECKKKLPDCFTFEKTDYKNMETPVIVTKNGEDIVITPYNLLKFLPENILTPTEKNEKKRQDRETKLINIAKQKFGDEYDYSEVHYIDDKTPVTITSKHYGKFQQKLTNHAYSQTGYPFSIETYTYELCEKVAKQYNTLSDFRKNDKVVYGYSIEKGYLQKFSWFQDEITIADNNVNKTKTSCVYIYKFPDKVCYIGLTNSITRRHNEHCTEKNDCVYVYSKKHNIPVPEPELIVEGVTKRQSANEEKKYIQQYRDNGWTLLNKSNGGAIGSVHCKWSEATVIEFCKQFERPRDLEVYNHKMYNYVYKHQIQEQCFKNSQTHPVVQQKYTPELLDELVKQYATKRELREKNPKLRVYLWKHELLDKYFPPSHPKYYRDNTERNEMILRLNAEGKKQQEIAKIVSLSIYSVRRIINNNKKKLDHILENL